jgi:RNA polymerase sigma-70 factor (ECF subfamily)
VLVTRVLEDSQRFESLVAEVYKPLQGYLRRRIDPDSADDVLADALLVMWRRLEDIPSESPLAWCYGVARGCLANKRRGADRHLKLVRRLANEREPALPSDDPILREALNGLPEGDREVLRLWAWEYLPPREIAIVLGITPNAASIRLHRATKKLKTELLRRQESESLGHSMEQQGKEEAP